MTMQTSVVSSAARLPAPEAALDGGLHRLEDDREDHRPEHRAVERDEQPEERDADEREQQQEGLVFQRRVHRRVPPAAARQR